jgi:hypothetical protein
LRCQLRLLSCLSIRALSVRALRGDRISRVGSSGGAGHGRPELVVVRVLELKVNLFSQSPNFTW